MHAKKRLAAVAELAAQLRPTIETRLAGRDLYAFTRKTHITLARTFGVNPDAVALQVGHVGGSVEEKFYLDESFIDPRQSSQAVYDLIQGRRDLPGPKDPGGGAARTFVPRYYDRLVKNEAESEASAVKMVEAQKPVALVDVTTDEHGIKSIPVRTRTADLRFRKPLY
ncbi:MAG TPA: hypothetical protein VKX17_13665 [Planctomycetota bacterium]|nr:hypothetical protein [Planctomycetota bacterium]